MSKHPHDPLIRAWLDGKTVQYRAETGVWVDLSGPDEVHKSPHWYADSEYRLKPVTVRYRLWLAHDDRAHLSTSLAQADVAEKLPSFRTWLTDWTAVTA